MEILNGGIEAYLDLLAPHHDPTLRALEEEAARARFPIVGPLVGRLLHQLVRLSGARRILELGSGFGYSAYWFGLALDDTGDLILTDFSARNLQRARSAFQQGGLRCRTDFRQGDALELIDRLEGDFDIIFNDVEKAYYPRVFEKALPRLRRGGLLISDNVLWHGKILDRQPDADTKGVLEYNRLCFNTPGLWSSIVPLRDGISLSTPI